MDILLLIRRALKKNKLLTKRVSKTKKNQNYAFYVFMRSLELIIANIILLIFRTNITIKSNKNKISAKLCLIVRESSSIYSLTRWMELFRKRKI